jgi:hypothetical protein
MSNIPDKFFRHRFQMRRSLFVQIVVAIKEHNNYFVQRRNDVALGFSYLQKVTVAYRQLAYVVMADYIVEYVRIGESI